MYTFVDVVVIVTSIIVILIVRTLVRTRAKPVFGIYQRVGGFYWFKVAFMFTILRIRQLINNRKSKNPKYNEFSEYVKIDCPQKLSYDDKAIDAVYFNCANGLGDHLVVGTARRKNQLIDGFLYLKLNNDEVGLLESPKLPDTSLYQDVEKDEYSAEGIRIYQIEPMKKWKICYEGKMKKFNKPDETCDVKFEVTWTSFLPYFNFDKHMDPLLMAKCMAREQWSREYFQCLEEVHQTHYEQHGDITGVATINGKPYNIYMSSLRDHSFGFKRDWKLFHRYGIHFLTTENGDRINIGVISMPICFSRMIIGYVYSAAEKSMYAVQDCDLKLYQHGENGTPPIDYAFTFKAGKYFRIKGRKRMFSKRGKQYVVEVNVVDSPAFYISKEWESKVVEGLCKFKVNGIKGWGSAEWVYRNIEGRSVKIN